MRWSKASAILATLVAIAVAPATERLALADGPAAVRNERAAALFKQAQLAFERKAFGAAATAFEEAAQLAPHPATWLDAGEARELDGNLPRAASDYDRALAIEDAPEGLR